MLRRLPSFVLSTAAAAFLAGSLACGPRPAAGPTAAPGSPDEAARWRARAARTTITRDDWGVPHVVGERDADAVFGLLYAQCEDDFPRVERNFLLALGRLAEAEGEQELMRDLRQRLYIEPAELRAQYDAAEPSLRALMDAWADGINYFLHTHPEVRPRVLTRFEPWMALAFSEGSIGGDLERISLDGLAALYGDAAGPVAARELPPASDPLLEPSGSNGIAIGPSRSASGKPLLLINPHTSFFFREEAHVQSGEGLDAYGAITWGQFFVYQGWNRRVAWMHTSSTVDNIDEYRETITRGGDGSLFAQHGAAQLPVAAERVELAYRTAQQTLATKAFTIYRTQHGPVVRKEGERWISVALMHKPVEALTQSFVRTKARSYDEFRAAMLLYANSSNNTVFADAAGTIAYFHAGFVPRRDPSFDWTKPVDGADPRTAWGAPHTLDESPHVKDPPIGWIQNTNDGPYSSAGPDSPRASAFPAYFDAVGETPRGVSATRVLSESRTLFTPESLLAVAFDPRMPELEAQVPQLLAAWDALPAADARRARTAAAVAALRGWDFRWSATSTATTVGVLWAEALWAEAVAPAKAASVSPYTWMRAVATPAQRLAALDAVVAKLAADFGPALPAWGAINRLQRLTPDIDARFSDEAPSIEVPFAPGRWGSLASFAVAPRPDLKKRYGVSGNSFVAVVELGEGSEHAKGGRVRARAVTVGGLSSDPRSPHFDDQSLLYSRGQLRDVYFWADELAGHVAARYRPGDLRGTARGSRDL